MTTAARDTVIVHNALGRYYDRVQEALWQAATAHDQTASGTFSPGYELPAQDAAVMEYLAASDLSFHELGEVEGTVVKLLDLSRNPRTRTTKTFASHIMVARAVKFIQTTGEPVLIVTPTSANKGTALRDAVLRAAEAGLVASEQLRIATVVPGASLSKVWRSALSTERRLATLNPVLVCPGSDGANVKCLAKAFADDQGERFTRDTGIHVWYTLEIDNYRTADVVRAFAEHEFCRAETSRTHVHAVSSAYGLLGHHFGREVLEQEGVATPPPGYFLVQQPAAPDMVLSLYFGTTNRDSVPEYRLDASAGVYRQERDKRFPFVIGDVNEVLDATFYTHNPPTSMAMNAVIGAQGGGGIVVSLQECLDAYASVRALLAETQVDLPADPRKLREWATVMAVTGARNALQRGLIETGEVVIHASGSYSNDTMDPIEGDALRTVGSIRDLSDAIGASVAPTSPARAVGSRRGPSSTSSLG